MSRIFKRNALLTDNPYNGQGVHVYVNGEFRNYRILTNRPQLRQGTAFPVGDATIPKDSASIGTGTGTAGQTVVVNPDLSAYVSSEITIDVRHYKDDVQAETVHPRKVTLDGSGNSDSVIRGSYALISAEVRSGGVVRVRFNYVQAANGIQPETFKISRTSGPTSPADISVDYAGTGVYEIDTLSLSDASPYTYNIIAVNTTLGVNRTLGPVTFTADATGPVAANSVIVEAF